jgi:Fur family ferric uptake transcriptional regulator
MDYNAVIATGRNKDPAMSHETIDLTALLHRRGYRATSQRKLVLDAVCEVGGHATPEEVYQRVQGMRAPVDRATVYRTLKFLVELDVLTATVHPSGQVAYEILADRPHHHLVCDRCGEDIEIPVETLRPLADNVRQRYGFEVDIEHLTLPGLCSGCSQEA